MRERLRGHKKENQRGGFNKGFNEGFVYIKTYKQNWQHMQVIHHVKKFLKDFVKCGVCVCVCTRLHGGGACLCLSVQGGTADSFSFVLAPVCFLPLSL